MPGQNSGSPPVAGARAPTRRPEGRAGLERGLDGGGDELRGLGVDGIVAGRAGQNPGTGQAAAVNAPVIPDGARRPRSDGAAG